MGKTKSATITLADQLDIKAAVPLAAELTAARGSDLRLNASQIERVGGQCLQILLSAAATWRADDRALALDEPSPAFADAIRIAGLDLTHFTAGSN